ncbi:Succinate-semialdehyde dehydrogenase [NAD] [Croceitalea dokdonensis DOKDO 023]|uniref:Succinate-semialdehyde dehydrogenase [NAD] n=1 Tax=Croceitalea dokdonensis DOKDO 023 TaxID=1300341 RepID=A0A0P7AZU9_9FLAO|nr:NAD-dependent succinate-semialdehyde dehydrogenase [Croceitalea dokdonensis]KPM32139.1 Succinate-semialdehyde dehydrogenase [NAD] [Croceitalea dokdonensis DOKDO 023]
MIDTSENKNTQKTVKPQEHTQKQLEGILALAQTGFLQWRKTSIAQRTTSLEYLSNLLLERKREYAELMTQEMGKPISQSLAEIEKCAWVCDFYVKNATRFLADELIQTEADESFISHDPLGVILGIMPWNFPFWQVIRFAAPTLTAGNVVILKHASNVSGCALALDQLFKDAGFPKGCFQTIFTDYDAIEDIISDQRIQGVSLTGSEKAGKSIASIAGKHMIKTVMELGGNNACVIWEDANLDKHMDTIVNARMQNTGQSCIAAKRFIVVDDIYEDFIEKFKEAVQKLIAGEPEDEDTEIGLMARTDLLEGLEVQIRKSVDQGAKVTLGNRSEGSYFEPTILEQVKPGMPVFDEEVFGPVAAVIRAKNRHDSLEMASNSKFGLGTMLFTEDIESARKAIGSIPDGSFFVNEMVKSDPRLPFGGTKSSGYGRELSKEGLLEFVNKKTVYINK